MRCALFSFAFTAPGALPDVLSLEVWGQRLWLLAMTVLALLGLAIVALQWWFRRQFRRSLELENRVDASAEAVALANRALKEASLLDPLTGLNNRRFLDTFLTTDVIQAQRAFKDMLAAGRDPTSAREDILLFMLDLDYFQHVNDTWGPAAGDAVLHQLGQALKVITRKTDFRARWEGGKLLLVARRALRSGAPVVARNLLAAVRDLNFHLPSGETIRQRVSIGFTALPLHPRHPDLGTWQEAVTITQQCLHAAKESGRDRWVGALFNPAADPEQLRELESLDLAQAQAGGILDLSSSEADFTWPLLPPEPDALI